MDANGAAETRANAVAMLKRAASLPRMKDGRRRPALHTHGESSENERTLVDEKKNESTDGNSSAAEVENKVDPPVSDDKRPLSPSSKPESQSKRRSRSRSRSRGSKDFKQKSKVADTATQSTSLTINTNDEGSEDQLGALPSRSALMDSASLLSPTPSYFTHIQMSQPLRSPASPLIYPGTSPPTPLPTLEALQNRHLQGLFRSNSAAARMMAMNKLVGGSEASDGATPRLGRNNTVGGGERIVARQLLLRRLNERIEKTEGDQVSSSEEGPSARSRRRRSHRKSGTPAVVDDRDLTSTTSIPASAPANLEPPSISASASSSPSPVPPRSMSTTPHQSPLSLSNQLGSRTATPTVIETNSLEYDTPLGRRGVVVEDEDYAPPPSQSPQLRHNLGLPQTLSLASAHFKSLRAPHSSDAPSTSSNESNRTNGFQVPLILSDPEQRSPYRQDIFPKSPFGTPIKEKLKEEDEEHVLYPDNHLSIRPAWTDNFDREISWNAELVPEVGPESSTERPVSWVDDIGPDSDAQPDRAVSWVDEPELSNRMPIHDEDEEEEEDADADVDDNDNDDDDDDILDDNTAFTESETIPTSFYHNSQQMAETEALIIERETSQDADSVSTLHSRSSLLDTARESNISTTSILSVPPDRVGSRAHSRTGSIRNWDDAHPIEAVDSKRSIESLGASAWVKVKNTFSLSRSGSSSGRRSRTNSTAGRDRRDNADSGRESGVSLSSSKRESKGEIPGQIAWQLSQSQTLQSPSATASILSLSSAPRSGVSPIPPPSDADNAKYLDPKLFPFPGMLKLQEESNRGRARAQSLSSPDIAVSPSIASEKQVSSTASSTSGQSSRDRKLSHQASDSRLLSKYNHFPLSPISKQSSSNSQLEGLAFTDHGTSSSLGNFSLKLPMNKEGVKKWLSARKLFYPQAPSGPIQETVSGSSFTRPEASKKLSLTDILRGRKDVDIVSDWEDMEKPRVSTSPSVSTVKASQPSNDFIVRAEVDETSPDGSSNTQSFERTSAFRSRFGQIDSISVEASDDPLILDIFSSPFPSPAEHSTTPDPASSVSTIPESPASGSRSSRASTYSSSDSLDRRDAFPQSQNPKSSEILKRLDQILTADSFSPMWASAINNPPRKLLLSSPMLQVVNSNTVKERFLFLFTDILIIAKPVASNRDSLFDASKLYPPDRKFVIKNVVQLKSLRLNTDRDDDLRRPFVLSMAYKSPPIQKFIEDFSINPDAAVAATFSTRSHQEVHAVLGRLFVQLPEFNKAHLGEFLSRRSSRYALKAYLDAIGLTGLDIDIALRIFLLSIHIPSGPGHANTLEYLLDTFAGRWYEANAGIVAFDKDLAVRLVRAIVRLNEALHSTPVPERGASLGISRHFAEAFRRHDLRGLVPDNTLEKIYSSIRQDKLCQARNPSHGRTSLIPIVLKRAVPSRLIYRRQSEPIVVRVPQIDPLLTIQLYGQDLTFEPPVLTFSKSTEASFRVTGGALGMKSLIMTCAGPNGPNYTNIPLSTSVLVERAFMRNTFQIAFINHVGAKRKYMFSVDDPVIKHEWIGSLKRQTETTLANLSPELPALVQVQVYQAAASLAFNVLRDTLLLQQPIPLNNAVASDDQSGTQGNRRHSQNARSISRNGMRSSSLVNGNSLQSVVGGFSPKATSRNGVDLLNEIQDIDRCSQRLWTSSELESLCQQNGSIPVVLSFLQAAVPFDSVDNAISMRGPTPLQVQSPSYHQLLSSYPI